jgi:hypothetical protein
MKFVSALHIPQLTGVCVGMSEAIPVVYDWLFRPLYIFMIMELRRRKIIHIAVTASPTD